MASNDQDVNTSNTVAVAYILNSPPWGPGPAIAPLLAQPHLRLAPALPASLRHRAALVYVDADSGNG